MSSKPLGRLTKVELREAWLSESGEFTPWLAQEDNLSLLGETIGIELELEAQEKDVGPFRADILCKDTATDNWVLIENQLERTDHCHLGQLLTYAAGLEAVTIVWIAKRFSDEHRAALDWLNEHTDEKINLFGLEVELWRIGESAVAPKFNVICQPNDWTKSVAPERNRQLSDGKRLQLSFWVLFRDYMAECSKLNVSKPYPQNWVNIPLGVTGTKLAAVFTSWNSDTNSWGGGEIRAEFVVDNHRAAFYFDLLKKQRGEIEKAIGSELVWYEAEGVRMRRAFLRKTIEATNEAAWPEYFEWLRVNLERFEEVFAPVVKKISQDKIQAEEMPG